MRLKSKAKIIDAVTINKAVLGSTTTLVEDCIGETFFS